MHQFFFGRFQSHGDDKPLNELGHFRPDHMGPDQFAGFGIKNGFDEAVRFAESDGLAVAHEREATDFQLVTGILCLGFGQTD